MTTYQKILLGLGITSLFLLELVGGWITYHVIGEVISGWQVPLS